MKHSGKSFKVTYARTNLWPATDLFKILTVQQANYWELADKSNAKYQPKILKLKNSIFMKPPKNPCKLSYFLGAENHPLIIIPGPQNSNGPWKCVCMISAWILTHPTLTTVPACASTFFGHVLMQMCMQLTRLWSFQMLGIDISASNKIGIDFDNAST